MTEEDATLNASELLTEEEILAEFQESCEAEAEEPRQHWETVTRATEDLFQMLDRSKQSSPGKEEMTEDCTDGALPSAEGRCRM